MAASNGYELNEPDPDYNSDSEPRISNRRPSNQRQVLPKIVQEELLGKINDTNASHIQTEAILNKAQKETHDGRITKETNSSKVVTISSNVSDIEVRVLSNPSQPSTTQQRVDESSTEVIPAVENGHLEKELNGSEGSTGHQTVIIEQPLRVSSDPLAVDKLTEDFGQLLDSEIDTDVTIKAGKHTFPAHRLILKARCPELLRTARAVVPLVPPPVPSLSSAASDSSCCSGPNKSKKNKKKQPVQQQEQQQPQQKPQEPELLSYVIELPSPPFTEDLIRGLLRYIYTARIEVLRGIIEELLVVAGDHLLFELKARLEDHLLESLNDDNCVRLLVFAADHESSKWDCRRLKRRALTYIKDRIQVIIDKEEFRKLKTENCNLLDQVLRAVVFGDEWIQGPTQSIRSFLL